MMPAPRLTATAVLMLSTVTFGAGPTLAQSGEVNLYSYRESKLLAPLIDAFNADTGIKVNVISASSGLDQRIKAEGENSPADVVMTVDIGRIDEMVQAGITQPIKSAEADKVVPAQYRDPNGHWYGISMRARVFYVSKAGQRHRADLRRTGRPKWKGRFAAARQHIYNNALFAAYVAHYGEAKAEEWLRGVKAQLAQSPPARPRDRPRRGGGKCDIGIGTPTTGR